MGQAAAAMPPLFCLSLYVNKCYTSVKRGDHMSTAETTRPPGAVCGLKVRRAREERGLSLSRLAQMANISVSYLSEVENGRKSPSLQVV